ncbi:MAG TPA: hypothetical protein VMY39_08515 [Planctomycetota bacterium]|nr:hypothetical protein [Planctomycetota bacterium]
MRHWRRTAVVVLAASLLMGLTCTMNAQTVYPGKTWQEKSPAEAGLDAAKLDAFAKYVGGRGCVTRHGTMVFTWGEATKRGDVASACKPLFAHFLLKALEDGKLKSIDERLVTFEPRLATINAALGHKDRMITFHHCVFQISCYQVAERPGTAFCYNDWQLALFFDTLFLKVYGATYDTLDAKVLHLMLTDALGCEDNPTMLAFGKKDRPGRVAVSPRDFCRFGLLYLRGGNWNGKQLISAEHAKLAVTAPLPDGFPRAGKTLAEMIPGQRTLGSSSKPDNQCDHLGSYSFLWWTNGIDREGKRHWRDAPVDTYGAFGHGGKRAMVVIPSLDVVLSWNDAKVQGREMENRALRLLVDSVTRGAARANP